jgi:hypothetical protein
MSNLLQKASIITTPTAYDTGKILSVKPVQYYGPELVTNGDFISNVNNWGTDSGATITWQSDQTALVTSTADSTFAIVQGNVLTVNTKYKVSLKFKPNYTGTFRVRLGGSSVTFYTSVFNVNEWNNIEFIGIADNTTLEIGSSGGSITNFYIDNVSVKEVINADFDFTRNSSATRVGSNGLIQDVASNLPRIDYTGGVGSWKFEPQRTNSFPYSNEFSNSDWAKNSSGIDTSIGNNGINENIAISPDGTLNADRVNFLLQSDLDVGIGKSIASSSGTTWSASVWIKGEGSNIGKNISFRLKRSSGGSYIGNDGTIELTSEWVRIEINSLTLIANNNGVRLILSSNDATSCLIYGAQLEVGSYPTSYIPTSGQSGGVTRLADVANNAGSSDLISSTEGVLYAEISALADDFTDKRISVSDGTMSNYVSIGYSRFSGNIVAEIVSGGVLQTVDFGATAINKTNNNKFSLNWGSGTMKFYVNGTQTNTESITSPTGLNILDFSTAVGTLNMVANTKCVAVFKEALTDLELECLVSWMSFSDLGINFGYTVE